MMNLTVAVMHVATCPAIFDTLTSQTSQTRVILDPAGRTLIRAYAEELQEENWFLSVVTMRDMMSASKPSDRRDFLGDFV